MCLNAHCCVTRTSCSDLTTGSWVTANLGGGGWWWVVVCVCVLSKDHNCPCRWSLMKSRSPSSTSFNWPTLQWRRRTEYLISGKVRIKSWFCVSLQWSSGRYLLDSTHDKEIIWGIFGRFFLVKDIEVSFAVYTWITPSVKISSIHYFLHFWIPSQSFSKVHNK